VVDLDEKATSTVREKEEWCRRPWRVPVPATAALTSHRTAGRREESG